MLTLPLCGVLKKRFPESKIIFLGRTYTEAIIRSCAFVDEFLNWDHIQADAPAAMRALLADTAIFVFPDPAVMKAARTAGIPRRIATAGRWSSWKYCTTRVFFSRRNSDLHECQLNIKLLKPLGINPDYSLSDLSTLYGFSARKPLPEHISALINRDKVRVVLHPFSKGSAVNWSPERFSELAGQLTPDRFQIFVTGSASEASAIRASFVFAPPDLVDLSGQLDLSELISFIAAADALVAASTGPLHIAAALGKKAIGLFSPKHPIHPERWGPVGPLAEVCVAEHHPERGQTLAIDAARVARQLMIFSEEKAGNTQRS